MQPPLPYMGGQLPPPPPAFGTAFPPHPTPGALELPFGTGEPQFPNSVWHRGAEGFHPPGGPPPYNNAVTAIITAPPQPHLQPHHNGVTILSAPSQHLLHHPTAFPVYELNTPVSQPIFQPPLTAPHANGNGTPTPCSTPLSAPIESPKSICSLSPRTHSPRIASSPSYYTNGTNGDVKSDLNNHHQTSIPSPHMSPYQKVLQSPGMIGTPLASPRAALVPPSTPSPAGSTIISPDSSLIELNHPNAEPGYPIMTTPKKDASSSGCSGLMEMGVTDSSSEQNTPNAKSNQENDTFSSPEHNNTLHTQVLEKINTKLKTKLLKQQQSASQKLHFYSSSSSDTTSVKHNPDGNEYREFNDILDSMMPLNGLPKLEGMIEEFNKSNTWAKESNISEDLDSISQYDLIGVSGLGGRSSQQKTPGSIQLPDSSSGTPPNSNEKSQNGDESKPETVAEITSTISPKVSPPGPSSMDPINSAGILLAVCSSAPEAKDFSLCTTVTDTVTDIKPSIVSSSHFLVNKTTDIEASHCHAPLPVVANYIVANERNVCCVTTDESSLVTTSNQDLNVCKKFTSQIPLKGIDIFPQKSMLSCVSSIYNEFKFKLTNPFIQRMSSDSIITPSSLFSGNVKQKTLKLPKPVKELKKEIKNENLPKSAIHMTLKERLELNIKEEPEPCNCNITNEGKNYTLIIKLPCYLRYCLYQDAVITFISKILNGCIF